MSLHDAGVVAGMISTSLFVVSYLPMLVKAVRSRDLASYSLANLAIANVGNLVHSVYVFSLPAGPIWVLHSFYLVSTALMLVWWWRFHWVPLASSQVAQDGPGHPVTADERPLDRGGVAVVAGGVHPPAHAGRRRLPRRGCLEGRRVRDPVPHDQLPVARRPAPDLGQVLPDGALVGGIRPAPAREAGGLHQGARPGGA